MEEHLEIDTGAPDMWEEYSRKYWRERGWATQWEKVDLELGPGLAGAAAEDGAAAARVRASVRAVERGSADAASDQGGVWVGVLEGKSCFRLQMRLKSMAIALVFGFSTSVHLRAQGMSA